MKTVRRKMKFGLLAFMLVAVFAMSFATPVSARADEDGDTAAEVDFVEDEMYCLGGGGNKGISSRTAITATSSRGYSSNGYYASTGERTIAGYVQNNAKPEVSLSTNSVAYNNGNGGVFKRIGADSHGGISPHVHQPIRNVAPNGMVYDSLGTKTYNGGVTLPSAKDVKQLYEYINNGKYQ